MAGLVLMNLTAWTLPVLADEPATPSSAAAPKPDGTAPSSAPSTPAPPAASTSSPIAKSIDPAEDKRLRSMGYRPELDKGVLYYCRSEVVVGSRLPSKICGTPADLDRVSQQSRDTVDQMQRAQLGAPPAK